MADETLMGAMQPSSEVPKPLQKPSIGRIVIYHFASHEFPINNNAAIAPAIITAVWSDTCVNLKVFADGVHDHWKTSANRGEGPAQWSWPARTSTDVPPPQPPPPTAPSQG